MTRGHRILFDGALVVVLGLSSLAVSQETRTADKATGLQREGTGEHAKASDKALAMCIAIDNQYAVQFAEDAAARAQNPQVKQFAEMLAKEHQAFGKKLEMWTGGPVTVTGGPGSGRTVRGQSPGAINEPARRTESNDTDATRPGTTSQAIAGTHGLDIAQLHREVADEYSKAVRTELESKSGAEFDRCFLGFEVGCHLGMLSKLTVFERHASPQLVEVISQGRESVQKHLTQAKELLTQIEKSGSQDRAARPTTGIERR